MIQSDINKILNLLPDTKKLRILSEWIDLLYDHKDPNPEVQRDLHRWADNIDEIKRILLNNQ